MHFQNWNKCGSTWSKKGNFNNIDGNKALNYGVEQTISISTDEIKKELTKSDNK